MKKFDGRKKHKVTIEITARDLLKAEDYLTCIAACDKHKSMDYKKEEEWKFEYPHLFCKECEKIRKDWHRSAWKINCKIWDALFPNDYDFKGNE